MGEAWLLFKVQLRARYSLRELSGVRGTGAKASAKRAGMALLIFIGFGSILMMFCMMLISFLKAAIAFGFPELVMQLVVLISMGLCAIFGVFVIMSNIYLAKDTALLYSLPVRSKSVFLSKLMLVYMTELIINMLIMIPSAVIYGTMTGMGAAFYFKALFVSLLMPAFPLLVALLIDSVLMLIVGRLRRRELVITVGSFVLMGAVMVGQFSLNAAMASAASAGEDFFANLFNTSWRSMNSIAVPPISWAASGIVGDFHETLFNLILFTVSVAVFFIIVYYAAGAIYKRAALYSLEAVKRYKKTDIKRLSGEFQSPVRAVFFKEWRVLLRSAIYATNSLVGIMIALMLIFLPFVTGGDGELTELSSMVDKWTAALLLAGVIGLFTSLNMGATTAVSREGKAFWLVKSLPVSYRDQVRAKLLFGLSIPPLWGVPLSIAFMLIFKLSAAAVLFGLALGLVISVASTAAGMIFDFVRPKLSWTNEAEAIKQNMNGILAMVLGAVLVAALGGLGYLALSSGLPLWAVCVSLAGLSAAIAAGSVFALIKIGESSLSKVEI